jgi:hypothetical protein
MAFASSNSDIDEIRYAFIPIARRHTRAGIARALVLRLESICMCLHKPRESKA